MSFYLRPYSIFKPFQRDPRDIRRTKSILIIAEHKNDTLTASTPRIITAAKQVGGELTVLVAGTNCSSVAKIVSTAKGLKRVLVAENSAFNGFLAENLTALVLAAQKKFAFTHIMSGATVFGKALLPRVAGKLNVPAVTDVTDVKNADTFVRPIYTGNAVMTLKVKDSLKIITVRQTSFAPCVFQDNKKLETKIALILRAININRSHKESRQNRKEYLRLKKAADSLTKWQKTKGNGAPILQAPLGTYNLGLSKIVTQNVNRSNTPDLNEAKIVICGGKGLKSKDNFKMLYKLGRKLNAAVGATKAAVDAGFAPIEIQIGQNGTIVAPDVYIAVGVSGSHRHIVGMKDSKIIIAINKDPSAPIFKIASYGLVADLFKVIPELCSKQILK